MELTSEQCRAFLSMCCTVARADGAVSAGEYEGLLGMLTRFSAGAVGFSELERWMADGPPEVQTRLPEDLIRMFLREALALARVDGQLVEAELETIRDLVTRYFDAPKG